MVAPLQEQAGASEPVPTTYKERDLMILMPIRKDVSAITFYTVLGIWDRSRMRLRSWERDSDIENARNRLAMLFLESGCSWSLWIDDDMALPFGDANGFREKCHGAQWTVQMPDEFLNLVTPDRLASWGKSIVGGLYFDRYGRGFPMIGTADQRGIQADYPMHAISPVEMVGTGALLVHRQVYLDIAKKFPDVAPGIGNGGKTSNFFTSWGEGGFTTMGEDRAFCRRALEAGHQPFVDLGLICGHEGRMIIGPPMKGEKARFKK